MKNKFGCNHLSFSYNFQLYLFIYLFIYCDIGTAKGKVLIVITSKW